MPLSMHTTVSRVCAEEHPQLPARGHRCGELRLSCGGLRAVIFPQVIGMKMRADYVYLAEIDVSFLPVIFFEKRKILV